MIRKVIVLTAFLMAHTCLAFCGSRTLTGDEWIRMLKDEKIEFVGAVIRSYKEQGIGISNTAGYYVYLLDSAIHANAQYETESVYELLRELLRRNEAGVQSVLHATKPSPQKIETH